MASAGIIALLCLNILHPVLGIGTIASNENLDGNSPCASNPETKEYRWVYNTTWRNSGTDQFYDMVMDNDNNIYITGRTDESTTDAFLAKFDQNGNYVWNTTFDGGAYDKGYGMTIDSANNIYIVGQTENSVSSNYNAFLVKYDSLGNQKWNVTWDGESGAPYMAEDVTIDHSGNVYFTGWVDPSEYDLFVAKYNSDGTQMWNTTWDDAAYEKGFGIAVDGSDNVLITGDYSKSGSNWQALLVKFNSDGDHVWNTTWDRSAEFDGGSSIALDDSNNTYITGSSDNSSGLSEIFIAQYNYLGAEIWNNTWDSGLGDDEGMDLVIDDSNEVYIVGSTAIDSTSVLKKFDGSGMEKWNTTYFLEGADTITRQSIALDSAHSIYIAGETKDDLFLTKYQEYTAPPDDNGDNEDDNEEDDDGDSSASAVIPGYNLPLLLGIILLTIVMVCQKKRKASIR